MDAYSSYILRAAHDRQNELRKETAERALSRAARQGRSPWQAWLVRRQRPAPRPNPAPAPAPAPVRCPACQAPLSLAIDELVSSSA